MKIISLCAFAAVMLTVACGNKVKQMEQPACIDHSIIQQPVEDSTAAPIEEETKQPEDKSSASAQSNISVLLPKYESAHYDNMRGFDPASEDDMDDNGMSRYMENNDEEGWD